MPFPKNAHSYYTVTQTPHHHCGSRSSSGSPWWVHPAVPFAVAVLLWVCSQLWLSLLLFPVVWLSSLYGTDILKALVALCFSDLSLFPEEWPSSLSNTYVLKAVAIVCFNDFNLSSIIWRPDVMAE